jgi:hypothetical protein
MVMIMVVSCRAGKDVDLLLVAGQSNAVGFDTSPDQLPPEYLNKNVMFWWRCGDPPADEYDANSDHKWLELQIQPRGNPKKGQPGNFRNRKGGFGPEMGLVHTLLKQQSNRPLAVVKVAYSATSVVEWDPKAGNCYQALVSETKLAIAKAKKQGITLHIRALVWIQGESDADGRHGPKYKDRLENMIVALRKDLGAPNMIVLLGLNTKFRHGGTYVRKIVQAQKDIAETSPYIEYVDDTGCEIINIYHFSSKGMLEYGKRFAEQLLQTEKEISE